MDKKTLVLDLPRVRSVVVQIIEDYIRDNESTKYLSSYTGDIAVYVDYNLDRMCSVLTISCCGELVKTVIRAREMAYGIDDLKTKILIPICALILKRLFNG